MSMPEDTTGHVNGWYCPRCGSITYGIHVTSGVTPMFLACRTPDCKGSAASLMYPWSRQFTADDPLPAWLAQPGKGVTIEWYRPTERELVELEPHVLEHARRGGLLLRPLTSEGMTLLEARLAPE